MAVHTFIILKKQTVTHSKQKSVVSRIPLEKLWPSIHLESNIKLFLQKS